MAATLGPASSLPTWIQFFRPTTTGRIEFSARLLLSSISGYCRNCTNSSGQTVFSGSYSVTSGKDQPFNWNGQGNDGSQLPEGKYTLHATMPDSSGTAMAVSTQVQGVVDSVDLTQSPPLLSIGGQTYTINQIRRIVS